MVSNETDETTIMDKLRDYWESQTPPPQYNFDQEMFLYSDSLYKSNDTDKPEDSPETQKWVKKAIEMGFTEENARKVVRARRSPYITMSFESLKVGDQSIGDYLDSLEN